MQAELNLRTRADPLQGRLLNEAMSGQTLPTPTAHAWLPEHLRLAVTAAGVALWVWNVDTDVFTMDERGFHLWSLPWRDTVTFEELPAHIHPADRDRVRSAFAATRAVMGAYETDFRILIGDEVR